MCDFVNTDCREACMKSQHRRISYVLYEGYARFDSPASTAAGRRAVSLCRRDVLFSMKIRSEIQKTVLKSCTIGFLIFRHMRYGTKNCVTLKLLFELRDMVVTAKLLPRLSEFGDFLFLLTKSFA